MKVGKTTCNENDSYIKIVKKSKGYELETTLICGVIHSIGITSYDKICGKAFNIKSPRIA